MMDHIVSVKIRPSCRSCVRSCWCQGQKKAGSAQSPPQAPKAQRPAPRPAPGPSPQRRRRRRRREPQLVLVLVMGLLVLVLLVVWMMVDGRGGRGGQGGLERRAEGSLELCVCVHSNQFETEQISLLGGRGLDWIGLNGHALPPESIHMSFHPPPRHPTTRPPH